MGGGRHRVRVPFVPLGDRVMGTPQSDVRSGNDHRDRCQPQHKRDDAFAADTVIQRGEFSFERPRVQMIPYKSRKYWITQLAPGVDLAIVT